MSFRVSKAFPEWGGGAPPLAPNLHAPANHPSDIRHRKVPGPVPSQSSGIWGDHNLQIMTRSMAGNPAGVASDMAPYRKRGHDRPRCPG